MNSVDQSRVRPAARFFHITRFAASCALLFLLPVQDCKASPPSGVDPLKDIVSTFKLPWKQTKQTLYSKNGKTVVIDAKRCRFQFKKGNLHPIEISVLVFVNPATGNVWAGRDVDFYVETDSGIIGGWLPDCILQWRKSFIGKINPGERLDDIAKRFATDKTYRAELITDDDLKPIADLRNVVEPWFFAVQEGGSEPPTSARSKKFQIKDGLLQMDLVGLSAAKATVWVDLDTRKVVKAVENGKQTFPKEKQK